jgi:hypothetical protein
VGVLFGLWWWRVIIVARVMFEDVGIEKTKQWLNQDMMGCLNKFFQLCNTSDFLKDREVS